MYFVTMVVQERRRLFGAVRGGVMCLSDAGRMVHRAWETLPQRSPTVRLDAFVVMPDHFHALLELPSQPRQCVEGGARAEGPVLTALVGAFKSLTTVRYARGVRELSWPPFAGRLWQRSFHDRVVRDREQAWVVRRYIQKNPINWALSQDGRDGGRGQTRADEVARRRGQGGLVVGVVEAGAEATGEGRERTTNPNS